MGRRPKSTRTAETPPGEPGIPLSNPLSRNPFVGEPGVPSGNPFSSNPFASGSGVPSGNPFADPPLRLYTGRQFVLLANDGLAEGQNLMKDKGGLKLRVSDEEAPQETELEEGEAVVFKTLGVAVCNAEPDQTAALARAAGSREAVQIVEPERYVFHAAMDAAWLRGYRDAVDHLCGRLLDEAGEAAMPSPAAVAFAAGMSWGVAVTLAGQSRFTGNGVNLAVLDTGVDLAHPDLQGRVADSASFIQGEAVQDGHGHGTHCCGVACGPAQPAGWRAMAWRPAPSCMSARC